MFRKTMFAAFFLVLTLFAWLPSNLSAQNGVEGGDVAYWNRLIEDKYKELKRTKESMALYMSMVDRLCEALESGVKADSIRFHQTRYMLAVNAGNPFEFKMVCFEMSRQTSSFERELEHAESVLRATSKYLDVTSRSAGELEAIVKLNPDPSSLEAAKKSVEAMRDFTRTLESLRDKLLKRIEPGRALLAERKACLSNMPDEILGNLKLNMFTTSLAIYESEFWFFLPHSFYRWGAWMPDFMLQKLPDSKGGWICSLVILLIVFPAAFLTLKRLLSRRIRFCERIKHGCGVLFKRVVLLASTACAFAASALALDMPENIVFMNIMLVAFSATCLELAWGLRLLFSDATRRGSPLYALFVADVIGLFLQTADAPASTLSILWPPLMFFQGFVCWRMIFDSSLGAQHRRMSQCFFGFNVAISALSGILALAGYGIMGIIIMKCWFLLALSVQFAEALGIALKSYVGRSRRMGYIARSLALGFAIPGIWLMAMASALFWMAWQLLDTASCFELAVHEFQFGEISFSPIGILLAVFLFFVVKTALDVLCAAIEGDLADGFVNAGIMRSLKSLLACVLWAVYTLIALKTFGVSLEHLGVILGGLSVGLGFGLQNFVNNFVSGLMLLFGRDIREGDIIQIGDIWAKVQKISLRSTLACTSDNAIISIPNANILSNQVVNWTLNNKHIRKDVKVPVDADANLASIEVRLVKLAAETKGLMKMPQPEVFVGSAGNELTLRVWIADIEQSERVVSELNLKVDELLGELSRKKAAAEAEAQNA